MKDLGKNLARYDLRRRVGKHGCTVAVVVVVDVVVDVVVGVDAGRIVAAIAAVSVVEHVESELAIATRRRRRRGQPDWQVVRAGLCSSCWCWCRAAAG